MRYYYSMCCPILLANWFGQSSQSQQNRCIDNLSALSIYLSIFARSRNRCMFIFLRPSLQLSLLALSLPFIHIWFCDSDCYGWWAIGVNKDYWGRLWTRSPLFLQFCFPLKRVLLSQNVTLGSPASGSPGNSSNHPWVNHHQCHCAA